MASRPFRKLILPAIVFAAFWVLGVTAWGLSGQRARRLTLVLVGGLLLALGRPVLATAAEEGPVQGAVAAVGDSTQGWGRGFGYGLTLSFDQARDDLLAPVRWSGPGIGLRGSWTWGGSDVRHVLALSVPLSVFSNRYGHEAYALAPTVAYGYLKPVAQGGSGSAWVGGRLRLDMFNGFYVSWDDEHLYWMTAYSLGPTAAWHGQARRLTTWLGLDVPLVAAVSRPSADRLNQIDRLTKLGGHFLDTQRALRFATLPGYAALHATAGVVVPLAGRFLSISYDLDWSTYDSPSRVSVMSHRVTLGHRASR